MDEEKLDEVIKRSDAIGDQIKTMKGEFDKIVGDFKGYCAELGTSYEDLVKYAKENAPEGEDRKEAEKYIEEVLKKEMGLDDVPSEPKKKKKTGRGLRRGKMTI